MLILVVAPCVADEWRLASTEEIMASWGDALSTTVNNQVIADFDGNGISDAARILRSEGTGRLFLVVALNEGTPSYRLLHLHQMDGLGIELIQPGTYKTLCGKGYDCPEGGPDEVTLKWPGLGVFKPESASWVMYWDIDANNFKEFGTSD
jgi:hypothetical protein